MFEIVQKNNGSLKNYEAEVMTKTGKIKTLLISSVRNNNKEYGTAIDISDRKKLEASLQEKEQRTSELAKNLELERNKLSAIINNLPIGLGIVEVKGKTFSLNKAGLEIHGFKSDAEASSHIDRYTEKFDLFYSDGRIMPVAEWPISRVKRGEFVKDYELCLKDKLDDRKLILSYSTLPIKDKSGAINLVILMIDDLTESKQAEEILKRDNETLETLVKERTAALIRAKKLSEIGTLASTIAHELRNPLAAIDLGAYNIGRKTTEKEKIEKHLKTIEKKVLESNQIINNLLHFARAKPPELKLVAIYELIMDSEKIAKGKYQKKEIQLVNDILQAKDSFIKGDSVQLQEVFSNVLNNAFDAIGEQGKINVNVQETKHIFKIIITDNGPGIPPEIADKVFEPFVSTKSKGTGLGLAISRQIIENHNGTITIDSENGTGTAVTIALPK